MEMDFVLESCAVQILSVSTAPSTCELDKVKKITRKVKLKPD